MVCVYDEPDGRGNLRVAKTPPLQEDDAPRHDFSEARTLNRNARSEPRRGILKSATRRYERTFLKHNAVF